MNMVQIIKMCENIAKDYEGMGRPVQSHDNDILNGIIHVYCNTDIDWEEVKWLWSQYLETGNLYLSVAQEMARARHQLMTTVNSLAAKQD